MTNRTSGSAPRILRVTDGFAAAEVGNVYVAVWRDEVTRPRFEAQREAFLQCLARHPEGVGFLCVIEPTAKPPGEELRKASAKMIQDHQKQLRCVACAVEQTGFLAAVSRSALSAMALLLGPRTVPVSFFGTVTAAVTWMIPHVDVRNTVAFARCVDAVRKELAP